MANLAIKPYYQDDNAGITIYCADYRDILDPGPLDVIITDPPYTNGDIGKRHIKHDFEIPSIDDIQRLFTITDTLAITPGIVNLWNYPPARWVLCWYKPGAPSFNKLGGYNVWEPILIYGKPRGRFGQDVIEQVPLNFKNGLEKQHPCPKPLKVWGWLVEGMTKPGDIVYDPFLGSGTTAVCCKKLGRRCIGVEIKEEYCELAVKRLAQEVMKLEV